MYDIVLCEDHNLALTHAKRSLINDYEEYNADLIGSEYSITVYPKSQKVINFHVKFNL